MEEAYRARGDAAPAAAEVLREGQPSSSAAGATAAAGKPGGRGRAAEAGSGAARPAGTSPPG